MLEDEKIKLFKEWLMNNGATYEKIDWPSSNTAGCVRGAVALQDIESGEIMLEIPSRLMMSPPNAYADPIIGPIFRENKDLLRGDVLLAVFVMNELGKGNRSFYAPFLQILPEPGSICLWNQSELTHLQDDKIVKRAKRRLSDIKLTFKTNIAPLHSRHPDIFLPDIFSYDRFKFAWFCIQSRGFGRRLPWTALVPFADCLNHNNVATKYDFNKNGNGKFRLFPSSTNRYGRGCEVFNSYGRRANDNLLLEYGFALLDNEWDEVAVDVSVVTDRITASTDAGTGTATDGDAGNPYAIKGAKIRFSDAVSEGVNPDAALYDTSSSDEEANSGFGLRKFLKTVVVRISAREPLPSQALTVCRCLIAPPGNRRRRALSDSISEPKSFFERSPRSDHIEEDADAGGSSSGDSQGVHSPSSQGESEASEGISHRDHIEMEAKNVALLLEALEHWESEQRTTLEEDESLYDRLQLYFIEQPSPEGGAGLGSTGGPNDGKNTMDQNVQDINILSNNLENVTLSEIIHQSEESNHQMRMMNAAGAWDDSANVGCEDEARAGEGGGGSGTDFDFDSIDDKNKLSSCLAYRITRKRIVKTVKERLQRLLTLLEGVLSFDADGSYQPLKEYETNKVLLQIVMGFDLFRPPVTPDARDYQVGSTELGSDVSTVQEEVRKSTSQFIEMKTQMSKFTTPSVVRAEHYLFRLFGHVI